MPCSTIAMATSRGVKVLAVFMMVAVVVRRGSSGDSQLKVVPLYDRYKSGVNCRRNEKTHPRLSRRDVP